MNPSELERTTKPSIEKAVVIDTETTGLIPETDEVLSIAIVDLDGNELFYSLVKPLERKRWTKATEVHGITWSDVKEKPTIFDVGNEVADILSDASLIIGYNVDFDIEMLYGNGLPRVSTDTYDLMHEYSLAYGRWSDKKGDYLWSSLAQCARKYKYDFKAHNALEDAKATAYCFKKFREECEIELPLAEKRRATAASFETERLQKEASVRAEIAKAAQEKKAVARRISTTLLIAVAIILILSTLPLLSGRTPNVLVVGVMYFIAAICLWRACTIKIK